MIDPYKVPDKIPQGYTVDLTHSWTGHHKHLVNFLKTSLTQYQLFPLSIRSKVCWEKISHPEGVKDEWWGRVHGIPGCLGCGGIRPWFVYPCYICAEFFIKDFNDPRFCFAFPVCWDHLSELPWTYCSDSNSPDRGLHNSGVYFEPTGLNPKKYSDEEKRNLGVKVFEF